MSTEREVLNELYETIKKSQDKILEIQKNCTHEQGYYVSLYSWRPGSSYAAQICNNCDYVLGPADEQESIKCLEENGITSNV